MCARPPEAIFPQAAFPEVNRFASTCVSGRGDRQWGKKDMLSAAGRWGSVEIL